MAGLCASDKNEAASPSKLLLEGKCKLWKSSFGVSRERGGGRRNKIWHFSVPLSLIWILNWLCPSFPLSDS